MKQSSKILNTKKVNSRKEWNGMTLKLIHTDSITAELRLRYRSFAIPAAQVGVLKSALLSASLNGERKGAS